MKKATTTTTPVYTITLDKDHVREMHTKTLDLATAFKCFTETVAKYGRAGSRARVTLLADTKVIEQYIDGLDYEYVRLIDEENAEIIARHKAEREAAEAATA